MFKSPRHIVASVGALVTIQGLIFTIIEHSTVSLAFTLLGLCIVAGGLHVECLAVVRQVQANLRDRAAHRMEQHERQQQTPIEFGQNGGEVEEFPNFESGGSEESVLPPFEPAEVHTSHGEVPSFDDENDPRVVVIVKESPVMLWNPGLAAVFSFFVPGLGQLYKSQPLNAVAWFVVVILGYSALIVPGVILHVCCVLGALSGNPMSRR